MARILGSDELFRLIHSLSKEEKGYFKKFATRHSASDSINLKLFNAISSQTVFEESDLKKSIKNYARAKVYLKDMIMDAMIIYYRNNHPHIQLLNQIQKIHLLLVKGLYNESLRLLKKTLESSEAMELFTLSRYLERIQRDLMAQTFNQKSDLRELATRFTELLSKNNLLEQNLTELELISMDWFEKSLGKNSANALELKEIEKKLPKQKALSKRAAIKLIEIQNWVGLSKDDVKSQVKLTEKRLLLSVDFRKKHDSSFNTFSAFDNHILSCIDSNQFEEALQFCNKMISSENNFTLNYNIAFVWANLRKWMIYTISGQYELGLKEMNKTNLQVFNLLNSHQDAPGLRAVRAYYIVRSLLLFSNKKYLDCWMCLNESFHVLKQNMTNIPGILMLQLMTQLEMGNYPLLKNMATQADKKIKSPNKQTDIFYQLINFFKKVNDQNIGDLSKETIKQMRASGNENEGLFGLFPYKNWFESKVSNTPSRIQKAKQ
jgi:hypothetical protein